MTEINHGTFNNEGNNMAQPALDTSREWLGKDLIDYISETLKIRRTMIAALLSVTERTLDNWKDTPVETSRSSKMMRLIAFHSVVTTALDSGVLPGVMMSFLNEPIDDEGSSLLGYIVDDPGNKLLSEVAGQRARDYLS